MLMVLPMMMENGWVFTGMVSLAMLLVISINFTRGLFQLIEQDAYVDLQTPGRNC